ncbi:MAG TPA: 16S rRNA (guanine(966)-N(2))-methyltransferase RsmD [Candidatus Eisenbacteria bacterium]
MGLIRVVGGALRGRRIRVPDRGVRPTSERTREAIFDVLGPAAVAGARVLDLYAGTGALGIEALSRGAAWADFAEGSRAVARRLSENLAALGLAERSRVLVADLGRAALPRAAAGPWEIVFLDPPYAGDAGSRWLGALASIAWPPAGGLVVYERFRGRETERPAGLALLTERDYGDTIVAFFRAERSAT